MRGAYLVSTVLSKANLSGANLRGAELISAILIGANLSNADLSSANLTHLLAHLPPPERLKYALETLWHLPTSNQLLKFKKNTESRIQNKALFPIWI